MDPYGVLNDLYYNPERPSSFSSPIQLYYAARKLLPNITLHNVNQWLRKQNVYTLHAPVRKTFTRRKTLSRGLYYQLQMDLVDMQKYKHWNNNFKYILTVIDIFSRKAFAIPLKSKHNVEIVRALQHLFTMYPIVKYVQTDQGTEFFGAPVREFFKSKGITHFFTSSDPKCALVERFNRTLKNKMFKYFTAKGTKRYIDVLDKFVEGYNNRVHSSIGIAPNRVTKENEKDVWNYQYSDYMNRLKHVRFKYDIGDVVRISKKSKSFSKGYLPNYNEEYFIIDRRAATVPPTYTLKDLNEETIIGSFYEAELEKVVVAGKEHVVLKRRKRRRQEEESFVHYIGHPPSHDEWIKTSLIKKVK